MDKTWMKAWYPFGNTKRLFRCYLPTMGDGAHFYTTNFEELTNQNYGKYVESAMGKVHTEQVSGTAKLYRYFNGKDHFYTTNYNELGSGKSGYKYEGYDGYVYTQAKTGTVPVYRYYNSKKGTHFYTTSKTELGNEKLGFKLEGIGFYILPN